MYKQNKKLIIFFPNHIKLSHLLKIQKKKKLKNTLQIKLISVTASVCSRE